MDVDEERCSLMLCEQFATVNHSLVPVALSNFNLIDEHCEPSFVRGLSV